MTTATVTYHDLPGSTKWRSDRTVSQESEDEIKWSHYLNQQPLDQMPIRKARQHKGRIPQTTPTEELCLVCGDKASGYHYNALTCEGCKGFFRRSITRKAVYYCKFGQTCDIDMYMRRKCQHCRLLKCIKIGMRAELVIPEEQCRIKREAKMKQRICPKEEDLEEMNVDQELSPEVFELTSRLVNLYQQNLIPNDEAMVSLSIHRSDPDYSPFQLLAELTIIDAQLAHEFVAQIPGISSLNAEDQRLILKASKSELIHLMNAQKFDLAEDCMVFGNDRYPIRINQTQYAIATTSTAAHEIFDYCRSFAKMRIDPSEFALLLAISVFADRPFLIDPKKIEEVQEIFTGALQEYLRINRPNQKSFFARLLVKLADLKILNASRCQAQLETVHRRNSMMEFDSNISIKPIGVELPLQEPRAYVSSHPL